MADLDNDGLVNLGDFNYQRTDWLNSGFELPGDLNRSGEVNIFDAALLVDDWLNYTVWWIE